MSFLFFTFFDFCLQSTPVSCIFDFFIIEKNMHESVVFFMKNAKNLPDLSDNPPTFQPHPAKF